MKLIKPNVALRRTKSLVLSGLLGYLDPESQQSQMLLKSVYLRKELMHMFWMAITYDLASIWILALQPKIEQRMLDAYLKSQS